MGPRTSILLVSLFFGGCGGATAEAEHAEPSGSEPAAAEPVETTSPPPEAARSPMWLAQLEEQGMLTYEVTLAGAEAPVEVRMLVQQRVTRGESVAVRLVPIGTPLGEDPIYPQWLIGTPDAMSALDETASFTTPGFVPIDESGRMRTEAASGQLWRVEARWIRAGAAASGVEAAVGWTLSERVGAIEEPVGADDCVRLERADESVTSTLLACAGVGVVERRDASDGVVRSQWRLTSIGERPRELE